MLIVLVIFY